MGSEKDLPPGEKLVACFRPFLEELVASDLSPKTIQKHVDNLWALGGEIIRDLHENPSLRRKDIEQILARPPRRDCGAKRIGARRQERDAERDRHENLHEAAAEGRHQIAERRKDDVARLVDRQIDQMEKRRAHRILTHGPPEEHERPIREQ